MKSLDQQTIDPTALRDRLNPSRSSLEEPANLEKDGTAAPTNTSTLVEAQSVDGVVNALAPCPGIGKSEIDTIASSVGGIDAMGIKDIEKKILKACNESSKNSEIAVKSSTVVIAYAWITGKMLVRAKSLLKKKGEFGEWCESHLVTRGLMSV